MIFSLFFSVSSLSFAFIIALKWATIGLNEVYHYNTNESHRLNCPNYNYLYGGSLLVLKKFELPRFKTVLQHTGVVAYQEFQNMMNIFLKSKLDHCAIFEFC